MVFALGIITLGSLVGTSVLTYINSFLPSSSWVTYSFEIANFCLSLFLFTLFFSALFRFLPEQRIGWRIVLRGGLSTAILFAVGKQLIGLYLGYSSVGSAFGAAGSLAVFLLWVYYSAAILLLGASITQHLVEKDENSTAKVSSVEPSPEKPLPK
jgi:membrane protein